MGAWVYNWWICHIVRLETTYWSVWTCYLFLSAQRWLVQMDASRFGCIQNVTLDCFWLSAPNCEEEAKSFYHVHWVARLGKIRTYSHSNLLFLYSTKSGGAQDRRLIVRPLYLVWIWTDHFQEPFVVKVNNINWYEYQ